MRDFNFFESFEQKHKRSEGPRINYPVVLLLIVVAAAIWPAANYYRISQLETSLEDHRRVLESDSRYPLFAVVEEKQQELAEETNALEEMKLVVAYIDQKEIITESLLLSIAGSMPPDTALTSMTVSQNSVQLQGVARSKPAVAEFEYNLRSTGKFENIFVPSLMESEGAWQFNMVFMTKGGADL